MSWIQQNANNYIHSDAPFSLQYIGSSWYLIDNRDQSKAIPIDDIYNNPVFPLNISTQTILAKHFRGQATGDLASPPHSFQGEINSGLYRESAGVLAFSVLGSKVLTINSIPSFLFKSWVSFNGVTPAILESGNVSGITKNATGDYTVTFSTNMPDANYGIFTTAHQDTTDTTFISFSVLSRTVSGYRIKYGHYDVGIYSPRDCDYVGSGVIR